MAYLLCSTHKVQLVTGHCYAISTYGKRIQFKFYRCPVKGCKYKRPDKHGEKNKKRN